MAWWYRDHLERERLWDRFPLSPLCGLVVQRPPRERESGIDSRYHLWVAWWYRDHLESGRLWDRFPLSPLCGLVVQRPPRERESGIDSRFHRSVAWWYNDHIESGDSGIDSRFHRSVAWWYGDHLERERLWDRFPLSPLCGLLLQRPPCDRETLGSNPAFTALWPGGMTLESNPAFMFGGLVV